MKRLIAMTFIIFLVFSLSAASFSVGLEAGANWNMIIAGKGYKNYTYTGKASYSISAPVLIELTPSLAVETGISFNGKNYGYQRSVDNGDESHYTLDFVTYNTFVELPFALRWTFALPFSNWSLFLSGGGFAGYWLTGRRAGLARNMGTEPALTPFDEKTDLVHYNRFQAGILTELGLEWQFSHSMEAYIKLGYSLSLTGLNEHQKYGAYPVHNSTLYLVSGLMWGINR